MKRILKFINNKPVESIIIVIMIAIIFLTTGFSTFQASLDASIGAIVRLKKDIRVTGITVASTANGGESNYEEYNVTEVYSGIKLPNSDSTVTYDIKVTNIGNVEMGMYDIVGLPDNLTYTISGYTLGDTLCDDVDSTVCALGSTTTLHVTIGYTENGYDSSTANETIPLDLEIKLFAKSSTARIGNQYFDTLALAIASVTTSEETTIVLLRDTTEELATTANQNIVLDLQTYHLNNLEGRPVIENYGNLKMINGTILTNSRQGAINNNKNATFTITGGSIRATGTRQAIYNNGGTVYISGSAYLSNTTSERAPVQNQAGSVMHITGGTIVAAKAQAIENKGTLTIGTADGNVYTSSPVIQGFTYGVNSSVNFTFNDGIVKGKTAAFNNTEKVIIEEENYSILNGTETIGTQKYYTATLGLQRIITFDPNGGTVAEVERYLAVGSQLGTLPVPTRTDYVFEGWYNENDELVDETYVATKDETLKAKWIYKSDIVVAMIGDTTYSSLADAIAAVPKDNTETTIVLMRNTSEAVKVLARQNIVLDFQSYALKNSGNAATIENYGTVKMISGTIRSNADTGAVNNNNGGKFTITGGSIIATGTRQTIYNNSGGIVEISGTAYLSSTAIGQPTNSSMERGTVQNLAGGTLKITGGTLIGQNQQAVSNEGTLIIGEEDGNIDATTPLIQGATCGLKSTVAYSFYDGIVKGKTSSISGEIPTTEEFGSINYSFEDIGGTPYSVAYPILNS